MKKKNFWKRHWVYVGFIVILGIVAVYWLGQNPISGKNNIKNNELMFETLTKGVDSSYKNFDTLVVQNLHEFESLWKKMYSGFVPPPDMPVVDFSNKTVIAVFFGEKATTGYSITIDKIVKANETVIVKYKTVSNKGGTAGQLVTRPYHIIEINKIVEEVKFQEIK